MAVVGDSFGADMPGEGATVRGHQDIPVRQKGRLWICAIQIDYGYYWSRSDVDDVRPIS